MASDLFREFDTNGDGKISIAEFQVGNDVCVCVWMRECKTRIPQPSRTHTEPLHDARQALPRAAGGGHRRGARRERRWFDRPQRVQGGTPHSIGIPASSCLPARSASVHAHSRHACQRRIHQPSRSPRLPTVRAIGFRRGCYQTRRSPDSSGPAPSRCERGPPWWWRGWAEPPQQGKLQARQQSAPHNQPLTGRAGPTGAIPPAWNALHGPSGTCPSPRPPLQAGHALLLAAREALGRRRR